MDIFLIIISLLLAFTLSPIKIKRIIRKILFLNTIKSLIFTFFRFKIGNNIYRINRNHYNDIYNGTYYNSLYTIIGNKRYNCYPKFKNRNAYIKDILFSEESIVKDTIKIDKEYKLSLFKVNLIKYLTNYESLENILYNILYNSNLPDFIKNLIHPPISSDPYIIEIIKRIFIFFRKKYKRVILSILILILSFLFKKYLYDGIKDNEIYIFIGIFFSILGIFDLFKKERED